MNSRVYVGNLPFSANDDSLKELFAADGRNVVSAQVITEPGTGRSRGFGFVEFGSPDEANKAIEALNGKDFQGRALVVNEAREQNRSGGGGGGRGGFRGDRSSGDRPSGGGGGSRGRGPKGPRW